ncbi:MAG TPA: DUF6491 family protein [Allosphingosinicella sp.]|jgi:hypothetical protein
MHKALILALAAAASLGGALPAAAQPGSQAQAHADAGEREVRVPFLHLGRARSFRAVDERTVYLHAGRDEWYRLTTFAPCINLPWAHHIGVDSHGGPLDRTSVLLVDGQRCALDSVVRSGEPPKRQRRSRSRS